MPLPSGPGNGRGDPGVRARNQLRGKVKLVTLGTVMAEVVVDVDGQELASVITRAPRSAWADRGDPVVAIVKSTDVLLGKIVRQGTRRSLERHAFRPPPRSAFEGLC